MSEIFYIKKDTCIPLLGVDFLGIIDRGTNIVELKPLTLCNLKCRYCFVSAGEYSTNFIIDSDYLIEQVQTLVDFKGNRDIEIHLAPYGEILLYKQLFPLLKSLWEIHGVKIISMQTNGLLLNPTLIQKLEDHDLTRINISLNTLNMEFAHYLSGTNHYDIDVLLKNIHLLLDTNINVLIAPVWFPGENDKDIHDIIRFIINLREQGYSEEKIQLGIQKYLIYKTGRKLKKIRPKTWGYFYQQLSELESKFNIKLKLGPLDFGIHERPLYTLGIDEGDTLPVTVVSPGRWSNECIGKINSRFSTKILLNNPLEYHNNLLKKNINVKVLSSKSNNNLITSYTPF